MMDTKIPQEEMQHEILVVEDSETQAEQLEYLLTSSGYKVRLARDGQEGLAQARAAKPSLVISDIAMPGMDGYAMCRELKKDPALQDVPVILVTALTSLHDVIKGLDCGADNFIRKPFDGRYLLGRIHFILANRALRATERVQLGMRIKLGGQTHFVTAERQQIFDLLISTYEEAIQMAEELRTQQTRIAHSYQSLEGLYKIAEALNPALTEDSVCEQALNHALDLPGALGGCVKLREADGSFRVAAAQDFGRLQYASGTCEACACQRKMETGELAAPMLIRDCALLGPGLAHISIPISVPGRALGLLNLAVSTDVMFNEDDLHVLATVGNQIATALERARLYMHMERLVNERTEALKMERNRLSAIVTTTGALVMITDVEGRITEFNPACEQSLGWTCDEATGRFFWELLPPERVEFIRNAFQAQLNMGTSVQVEQEWLARNGERRTIIWSVTTIKLPDGTVERVLGTGLDVTELRKAEDQVQYLSNFDVLTGLPNRVLLRGQARLAKEQALSEEGILGLLVVCLPRLSQVRENLGENSEQELLVLIARRLKAWGSERGANVARYGDACFALIHVCAGVDDLESDARQLLALLEEPIVIDQQELHMDVGIGIAVYPNDGQDFHWLCQCAESAMRRAVEARHGRYEFYRPELNHGASERFKLESALRRALKRDELVLHYQPQVSLTSGRIIGVEALLRWQHPELGLISPGRFIDLAEETGLILPIGEWVLRKACEQRCAWNRDGVPAVPVAVNLSARQFSTSIADTVREILDETGLEPRLLELELTESLSMEDPESTFGILSTLKDMGVGLAIDDFGTGYSNLNYLKRFPVDRLKLDRSFVQDITSDPDDLAIARAVIAMAHSLRLSIIAEGVETEGQLALLAQNGCDEVQGYLFSRPVDAAACAKYIKEGRCLDVSRYARKAGDRTLLVVDDDVNLLDAIRRALRNSGCTVLVADSTTNAFEVLATEKVNVVLCDQRMPGMSGTEFLARVRQMHPSVVRMVLSGYTDLQSVTEAINRGAIFKFLSKPWEDKELSAAIEDAFSEYSANQVNEGGFARAALKP